MIYQRKEVIGNATLYLGDALQVLPTISGRFAIISDPPYGQAQKVNTYHAGGTREHAVVQRNGKTVMVRPNVHAAIEGDDEPFDPRPLLAFSNQLLLWGAHKFGHLLPEGRSLVWDKVPTGKLRSQGDGEIAWTNVNPSAPLRIFRLLWDGLCVGTGARHEVTAGQKRLHPMQKPEVLMRWCIEQIGAPAIIVDPYMGSGSTGVAAVKIPSTFIGVESVPAYFEIACERLQRAHDEYELAKRQGQLFGAAA